MARSRPAGLADTGRWMGLLAFLWLLTPALSRGETASQPASGTTTSGRIPSYVRIDGGPVNQSGRLQVARVTLRHPTTDRRVVLEGVVHIGEKTYYQGLQKRLTAYDRVLYEFVRPEHAGDGMIPYHDPSSFSLVTMLSQSLDLVHQLDALDYDQENFVWADLDAKEFREIAGLDSVNELSLIGAVVTSTVKNEILGALGSKPGIEDKSAGLQEDILSLQNNSTLGSREVKWFLARQLVRAESLSSQLLDPQLRKALQSAREERAVEVLDRVLTEAPRAQIAILYGAGHMPTLQDRLLTKGFTIEQVAWDDAWSY